MASGGAASRESLAGATGELDALVDRSTAADLGTLADQLGSVAVVLDRQAALRRSLADPGVDPDRREALFERLFGERLDLRARELLRPLVRDRWSSPLDLVDAVEVLSRRAALGVAERTGTLDDVEDELFRFGRILEAEPGLRQAMEERTGPAERRTELLDRLVGDRVDPTTRRLLVQAVAAPRGRSLDRAIDELVQLAASRRERYVAYVTAAAPLGAQQEGRLTAALARIYGRAVSLRVDVEPELLGGLVVRVNDEVIDGSVLSRLTGLRQRLAG